MYIISIRNTTDFMLMIAFWLKPWGMCQFSFEVLQWHCNLAFQSSFNHREWPFRAEPRIDLPWSASGRKTASRWELLTEFCRWGQEMGPPRWSAWVKAKVMRSSGAWSLVICVWNVIGFAFPSLVTRLRTRPKMLFSVCFAALLNVTE